MIQSLAFHAQTPGSRLLITGAVHGKEKCGTKAIKRFIAEIESGALTLRRGRLTLIPICNPEAYARDVRYIDRNLNRNLVPVAAPQNYEERLGNILCPLLADCDVLLDIHSTSAAGPCYALADPADVENLAYATALNTEWIVSNFAGAIAAGGGSEDPGTWAIGTTEYVRMQGGMSITLECGQHDDPTAPERAYQAILATLRYLDMLNNPTPQATHQVPHVALDKCWFYQGCGSFAHDWQNLERITKNTLIATLADGTPFHAPRDCIMVLPNKNPQIQTGDEWFYLGHEA